MTRCTATTDGWTGGGGGGGGAVGGNDGSAVHAVISARPVKKMTSRLIETSNTFGIVVP
jgi:hypothetical protein